MTPDTNALAFSSAAVSSGTRLSTTCPCVVCSTLLSPRRTVTSSLCANRFAFSQSCWNCSLLRTRFTASCTWAFAAFAIGPARKVARGGRASAIAACGSNASYSWLVTSRLTAAMTALSRAMGATVLTYVSVCRTVRCAHADATVIGSSRTNSTTSTAETTRRVLCACGGVIRTSGGEGLGLERVELDRRDGAAVEQLLRLRDLGCASAAVRGDVRRDLLLLRLHGLHASLSHRRALRDHVHQHAEQRDEQQRAGPQRLHPAGHVVPAEHVREDRDQDPDPHHEQEEDDDAPEHIEQRVAAIGQRHEGLLFRRHAQSGADAARHPVWVNGTRGAGRHRPVTRCG